MNPTDEEITTALSELIHRSDRAYASPIEGLREGSLFGEFVQSIRDTRDAIKPLGDPKASALLDEMENLTQRMKEGEEAREFDELMTAAGYLCSSSRALWNYLDRTMPRPELLGLLGAAPDDDIDTIIVKVTQHLSTLCQ
jgi:hypothetical protein